MRAVNIVNPGIIVNKLANDVADKARRSLGSYCFDECKAYCYRKGCLES